MGYVKLMGRLVVDMVHYVAAALAVAAVAVGFLFLVWAEPDYYRAAGLTAFAVAAIVAADAIMLAAVIRWDRAQ